MNVLRADKDRTVPVQVVWARPGEEEEDRMSRYVRRRPSPATVISLVALLVALGGTGYAAVSLPRNSVGTAQIKNEAVTKAKINKKTIASLKGNRGPAGARGSEGPTGPAGPRRRAGP